MLRLLDEQEVLSFSLDDNNDSFSMICVQAKDLYLYIVDFIKGEVVTKIADRNSVLMKGVFYKYTQRGKTMRDFTGVKAFVEDQESLGNKVLLPKLNTEFVIVQQGTSCTVKIYSIEQQRFIREFVLDKDGAFFEGKQSDDNDKEKTSKRERRRVDDFIDDNVTEALTFKYLGLHSKNKEFTRVHARTITNIDQML